MMRRILGRLLLTYGMFLVASPGCTKSVCETKNDCPAGSMCSAGACVEGCSADTECPEGRFCDKQMGLCQLGCRSNLDCANEDECVRNQCRPKTGPSPSTDAGATDAGPGPHAEPGPDTGPGACICSQAPAACLYDINPASKTEGKLVCEPGAPPRPALLFFGNVGCSHCQSIFGSLLTIESQLQSEGYDPTLVFVQLMDWTYTGEEVASTFPTHKGPVLQDTSSENLWSTYAAEWYDVKIIDTHGCLSAIFGDPDTQNLQFNGELYTVGKLVKEAWRSAMDGACHPPIDAGLSDEVGP
jgi:hypothetical protein